MSSEPALAPAPAVSPRRSGPADPGRVDALDGIRAVAVVAVLAYHVGVPGMSAGFLGVDAFFVLSGFLITGLLLTDVRGHGRVRLGVFWSRRVRRLMPAFLLVVAAVLVWGATLAPGYQRDPLRSDATMSLLYLGNWHFITTSSYFADDGLDSPLQHVWSLAVEEQFYIVWPLLVAVVALGVRRLRGRGRHRRESSWAPGAASVLGLAVAVSALSVVLLAVLYDPESPERAYMGTDARAFEPLLGAALAAAMTSSRVRGWFARHAALLVSGGLAGFAAGVVLLGAGADGGASSGYFLGGALAFSLACLLLVGGAAAGDAGRGPNRMLAAAPVAALGRVSYGVYLWHWPLVVWLLPEGGFDPAGAALVVGLTLLAAWLSYVLVETPVRRGRVAAWLVPRRLVPAVALALAAGITSASALVEPPVQPGQDVVLLVGDSVPNRLFPALAEEQERRGGALVTAAAGSCPGLAVPVTDGTGEPFTEGVDCGDVAATQAEAVREADPTVVVWWSRYELADRLGPGGRVLEAGTPEFWQAQRDDLRAAVDRLTGEGAVLVMVRTDRPGVGMRTRCTAQECHPFLRRLLEQDGLRTRWNVEVDRLAATDPRVRAIDLDDAYCRDEAIPCDDTLPDGTLARPDGSHFADAVMPELAQELLDRVEAARG